MPSSQALTLHEASQMTTPSALRPEQTREAGPGHRVHPKTGPPALSLEVKTPWPNLMHLFSPFARPEIFLDSMDLCSQNNGIYLYLPTANTQGKTGVNWEGELSLNTHTQILLTRN